MSAGGCRMSGILYFAVLVFLEKERKGRAKRQGQMSGSAQAFLRVFAPLEKVRKGKRCTFRRSKKRQEQ
eukprot:scaffold2374_cov196-Chaetoceros_neogracile.AAC.2